MEKLIGGCGGRLPERCARALVPCVLVAVASLAAGGQPDARSPAAGLAVRAYRPAIPAPYGDGASGKSSMSASTPVPGQRDSCLARPGDRIKVLVSGRADLSCEVSVPRGGKVVLPGAGAVHITGRSVEELSREIAALLEAREFLADARVVVTVASRGTRRAFVSGAVTQVRAVELPPESELTLTQAISSCGGFSEDADRAHVRIVRRESRAEPRTILVDAEAISRGETPALDPALVPGDTIYVPKREPVYVIGQVG